MVVAGVSMLQLMVVLEVEVVLVQLVLMDGTSGKVVMVVLV
jgi:hypothetical protein